MILRHPQGKIKKYLSI